MAVELNTSVKTPQTMGSTIDQFTKLSGDSTKTKEVLGKALEVLAGANVRITRTDDTTATGTGEKKTAGATNVPSLDNPADLKQLEANLEKLLSYLQMDNEERQTQMAKDRIEVQKDTLDAERKNRSEKIDKSLKDMDKAAESRKANKIFGWLMTALAVVAAVVACVATGGLAVGPVIGAAIAIGCQVLSETGVMDKITEKLAKGLESLGLSKQASQILAQVLITVAIMAASLGAGLAGGGAAAVSNAVNGSTKAIEQVRAAIAIASMVVGGISTVSGGVGAYQGYQAGMSEADVKETEKFIAALQQRLEESEEELEKILQQIQNAISQVADMISSATDTSAEIAQNIGAMA